LRADLDLDAGKKRLVDFGKLGFESGHSVLRDIAGRCVARDRWAGASADEVVHRQLERLSDGVMRGNVERAEAVGEMSVAGMVKLRTKVCRDQLEVIDPATDVE